MRSTRPIVPAGARRRSFGARAGVGGGPLQRFALERIALLQIEAHVVHRVGAAGDGDIDDLANARDVVEAHFDGVARDDSRAAPGGR